MYLTLNRPVRHYALLAFFTWILTACATPTKTDPTDPWEDWNREMQGFNDQVDEYVMTPVSKGYKWITPTFVDHGITNFFSNIDDIGVFLNDFLQFKPVQGSQDMGRFVINSVAGVGGLIDVAGYLELPKHKEDLDQTLAVWGLPSGPYLVLPFFGPSSPRGVGGLIGDSATNPINYIAPMAVPLLTGTLNATDKRADMLSASKILESAAQDRYEFIRNAYWQERSYSISDGEPPLDEALEQEEQEIDAELERQAGTPQ